MDQISLFDAQNIQETHSILCPSLFFVIDGSQRMERYPGPAKISSVIVELESEHAARGHRWFSAQYSAIEAAVKLRDISASFLQHCSATQIMARKRIAGQLPS